MTSKTSKTSKTTSPLWDKQIKSNTFKPFDPFEEENEKANLNALFNAVGAVANQNQLYAYNTILGDNTSGAILYERYDNGWETEKASTTVSMLKADNAKLKAENESLRIAQQALTTRIKEMERSLTELAGELSQKKLKDLIEKGQFGEVGEKW